MSLAEQKRELLKIINDADEATTAKIIDFVQLLNEQQSEFSAEDLAEFNRRREEFLKNPEIGISWEESIERLRNKLQK